jgi:hypothetical protein
VANEFGISFSMFTDPFNAMVADANRLSDRATMYALRATGRRLASRARSKAPVYKGDDYRARGESGNLRRSIRNARRLTSAGGNYSLKVGPFPSKKQGTEVVRYGTRRGVAIDSRTAAHLGIAGPSMKHGETTQGQVRGVQLYRRKMEEKYGYMAAGFASLEGEITEIYQSAIAKALEKYRG